MKTWKCAVFFALVLIVSLCTGALVACGDDDDDDSDSDIDDDADDDDTGDDDILELKTATFNAGLAHGFIPYVPERRSLIEDALAASAGTQAFCLQEVWADEDILSVAGAVADAFPYQFSHDSGAEWRELPDEEAPCDDVTEVQECAEANCDGMSGAEFTDCMVANCLVQLAELSGDCFVCLSANIDMVLDDIVDVCTNPGPEPRMYGGSNGLMLLSDRQPLETEWHELDFFLITRGVLYSKIEMPTGPVHLFCTHLTTSVSIIPYFGLYESFEDENYEQILDILDYVETKAGDEPAILMGDFNAGPVAPDAEANYLASYEAIINAGFVDPFFEIDPQCTFCAENPLSDSIGGTYIDHVLLKNIENDAQYSVDRIFDDAVNINVDDDVVETRISDHYGVSVDIGP